MLDYKQIKKQFYYQIDKKYNILMGYLSEEDLLSEWLTKFGEEHGDLEASLGTLHKSQNARLQIGVMHAKALCKIDWFVKDHGALFTPLWKKYQEIVDPTPNTSELIELIEKEDFMQVQSMMEKLQSRVEVAKQTNSGNLDALKRSLSHAQSITWSSIDRKSRISSFKSN